MPLISSAYLVRHTTMPWYSSLTYVTTYFAHLPEKVLAKHKEAAPVISHHSVVGATGCHDNPVLC